MRHSYCHLRAGGQADWEAVIKKNCYRKSQQGVGKMAGPLSPWRENIAQLTTGFLGLWEWEAPEETPPHTSHTDSINRD